MRQKKNGTERSGLGPKEKNSIRKKAPKHREKSGPRKKIGGGEEGNRTKKNHATEKYCLRAEVGEGKEKWNKKKIGKKKNVLPGPNETDGEHASRNKREKSAINL